MKASEMLELAKAGYKPSEIAEMHKLMKEADPEGTGTEPEGTGTEPEGTGTEPDGTGTEPDGTGTEPEGTGADPEGNKDYKALYLESLKKLSEAQQDNRRQNAAGASPENPFETLSSTIRGFM